MRTVAGGGDDDGQRPAASARASGSVVDRATHDRARPRALRYLRLRRERPERELLPRPVSLTFLLTVPDHQLRAPDLSGDRRLVQPLARVPHRRLAARVPCDLLLLPPL